MGQLKECAKSRASFWEGRWGSAMATTATPSERRWYKLMRCSLPIMPTPTIPYLTVFEAAITDIFGALQPLTHREI